MHVRRLWAQISVPANEFFGKISATVYLYDHLVLELIRYKAVTCTMYKLSIVGMSGRSTPILKKGPFKEKCKILPSSFFPQSFIILASARNQRPPPQIDESDWK